MAEVDAVDVLGSVIKTGQSQLRTLGVAEIEKFIANQPDVIGSVRISDVRGNAKVGSSSGIVVFTAEFDAGQGRKPQDLVLRYAPGSDSRLYFEYDLARQFRVQRALQGTGVLAPNPLWLDADGSQLGLPGYIMTMSPGEAPSPSAFAQGPIANATPEQRERMIEQVLNNLVAVHRVDVKARGLEDFVMQAAGETPMQKCINWYWNTWEWINVPDYQRLVPVHRWLLANAPRGGETLIHGDSTLHNYMFVGDKLTAVLDWEMSCITRPECDLALQCIGNELFAMPPETGAAQPPSQAEWLERYARAGGLPMENFSYYRQFTAYMIVVALSSVQRNMTQEMRDAQKPFMERIWAIAEAG